MTTTNQFAAADNPTLTNPHFNCVPANIVDRGDGGWHLFDYDGDGRDDLFVSRGAGQGWTLHLATGNGGFNMAQNELSAMVPAIVSSNDPLAQPQLADLNGDGLVDVIYPRAGAMRVRLSERVGSGFVFGAERLLQVDESTLGSIGHGCDEVGMPPGGMFPDCQRWISGMPTSKTGFMQMADFNGDAASDVLIRITSQYRYWTGYPGCQYHIQGNASSNDGMLSAYMPSPMDNDQAMLAMQPLMRDPCWETVFTDQLHALVVTQITNTSITLSNYAMLGTGNPEAIVLGDVNGDGLTDIFIRNRNAQWGYWINRGNGFSYQASLPVSSNPEHVRFADVNGDGRTDMLYPVSAPNSGTIVIYHVRHALPNGSFAAAVPLAGGNARLCESITCRPEHRAPVFADFDGDGHIDFASFNITSGNFGMYLSRSASRFAPRDTIVAITNGFGARTQLRYAPLTNKDVYRRDSGARSLNTGRGAPVTDLLSPMYVVAQASSSAPTAENPNAMATVHYRYAGAKVQAGGRGFLGFRQITTFDSNQSATQHVATVTQYRQDFPYIGLPQITEKRLLTGVYAVPACLANHMAEHCFATPGQGFAALGGVVFSSSTQAWEADTNIAAGYRDFSPTQQFPVHVRTAGTEEISRDPTSAAITSRVQTTFAYGAYGNVTQTSVDTRNAAGTLVGSVSTSNTYGDNVTRWRLGRLTASAVTHERPGEAPVARNTSFAYAMSGAATGLLLAERLQPGGDASQDLRTSYILDDFGKRLRSTQCAAPATTCADTPEFQPADARRIHRSSRVLFDSRGRYPVRTYEYFRNAAGATIEVTTSRIVSRDVFGNPTHATDINGNAALSTAGQLGRAYYTWVQTVPGAQPGDTAGGVQSYTRYRWCGGSITCPTGARVRQEVVTTAAPSQWTYLDVLGRPVMQVTQSANVGASGKDASAICTAYTPAGQVRRVSNPFFLGGVSTGTNGPAIAASVCTAAQRQWTTTEYDTLGRVTRVTAPDNTATTSAYAGLTTTITNARGQTSSTVVNALGEAVRITDALGTHTDHRYTADGNLRQVLRDSGRGVIRNTFVYDTLGRKVTQHDPDSGTTTFAYNAAGELLTQTQADGSRIESRYDARGRVYQRASVQADGHTETTTTFTFDTAAYGRGQLAREHISGHYQHWRSDNSLTHQFQRSYSFDALGRPNGSTTTIDGVAYTTHVQFNALGQAYKAQDASGRYSLTHFGARGHVRAICETTATSASTGCPGSTVPANAHQRTAYLAQETDAWGQVIRERLGQRQHMEVTRHFNPTTGRLAQLCAGTATDCGIINEQYAWDALGNLHTQLKENRYLETFTYDALNRLTSARIGSQQTLAQSYDRLGNICRRNEYGTHDYHYTGRAGCGLGNGNSGYGSGGFSDIRPHAVNQLGQSHYAYDAKGNQTTRTGGNAPNRIIHYSADNHAYSIEMSNGTRARFWYGSDGQRYKRQDQDGKITLYLGNVEIIKQGASQTIKRVVAGVQQQTIIGNTITTRYFFHDRLGSITRITDAEGNPEASQDYKAYGGRRDYNNPNATGTPTNLTDRGYTGHEHLDGLDVIHMNGRIYDPVLHRFLQPDPVIQSPGNLQSWNAYTYVFNNPLVYTDPSGMISLRQVFAVIVGIAAAIAGQYYITQGMYIAAFGVTTAGGFVAGYIQTGTIRGATYGALSAGITFGIGVSQIGPIDELLLRSLSGGLLESLQGGKFGNGFLAAGLTTAFMPGAAHRNVVVRAFRGSLIGGTISSITGGKFANGAVSGAIQGAMMGSDEPYLIHANENSGVTDFSDAPIPVREKLNDPNQREGEVVKIFKDEYGGGMSKAVTFGDVHRVRRSTGGWTNPDPNVAGAVFPRRIFELRPRIVIYNQAFNIGSYAALKSIIHHEARHYHQFTGRVRGIQNTQPAREIDAISYEMSKSTWIITPPSYKRSIIRRKWKCAEADVC